jgi:hypothetical protein
LNLADYSRYLCEVTLSERVREDMAKETESAYQKYFAHVQEAGLYIVNPAYLTGVYHYAIFLFEILNKKIDAILYLKKRHQEIIDNLDNAFKLYVDSYPLLDILTDTLTNWVIATNYGNINKDHSNDF